MTIELPPEQAKIVEDELKSGHYQTAQEVANEALHALRARKQSAEKAGTPEQQREAVNDMLRFVDANRVRLEGVTVKESIDEGHHR
jgi:Arc/MetJ-type ribon-helix-helix transcriptional regulator